MNENVLQYLPKKVFEYDTEAVAETKDLFKERYVGIYFTGLWCKYCEEFSDYLEEVYDDLNSNYYAFEIIHIPLEHEKEGYRFPWYFTLSESCSNTLCAKFEVNTIPTLLIFDDQGHLVDLNGVQTIRKKGSRALLEWESRTSSKICFDEECSNILNKY